MDLTTKNYGYGSGIQLVSLYDESGAEFSSWGYDSQGRGNSTQESGGANAISLTYNPDGTVTSTDALGAVRTFSYSRVGDINKVTGISGSQCPTCQESAATTYDATGFVSSRTDYNGNLTCYANDPARGLEVARVEGFAPGSACPGTLSTYTPASGTQQRKILTQLHSIWRLPAKVAQPLKITTWVYNGDGGVLCAPSTAIVGGNPIGVVCSRTEQGTTDATGGTGFTATASGSPRVWSYTYNSFGQVLTVNGPRTVVNDVTTYTYYNCTTGSNCGQINTRTSAATTNAPSGLVTTFLTYDAYGKLRTMTDPNGVLTTLTYDAGERLQSSQTGSETTGFTYWLTGLLKLVTLPDGSTILYGYDGAHRLTDITDGVGNNIHYTLDGLGNRTGENIYDSSTVPRRTHTRVFNALSQLNQDINAANSSSVTTTYGYDPQGNLLSIAAPMSRNTGLIYDELNRIKQITDPMTGVTNLTYDGNDNLASVKDPRLFPTTYTLDGFNEVTQLVNRDTGTSSSTYDTAGNLKTTTDARGAGAIYSYDALNRVSQIAYTDQTFNFTYDTGTNGLGRLTGASDASHSMSWAYDTLGRVTGKGQTVAGVTRSVGYGYINGDMTALTTPSGQSVVYGYTNHRITSITVNGTTVLNSVTYDPFGPATGWTWGNATTTSRSFDLDGNPAQIIAAGATYNYTPDYASRIQSISDSAVPADSFTFGYDNLDRVGSATSSALSRGYTYDANGNRLTTTGPTSTENVGTLTNRLNSISGTPARAYTYDSAGNTLTFTGETFTFNQRGRMSTATSSSGVTTYVYNALGQMIDKSGNGGTMLLMYDEAGHILGEYSSTGALIQETIWMGDTPVATIRLNGSAGCTTTSAVCIFYVHTDHLGTPRKVTRASDNVQMWRWDPDTFGSVPPTGLGAFSYKLRFPGMYALNESGLFYNYFRDYDPQTGRYLESDPIGLYGGSWSTYAYVNGNPISYYDPLGQGPIGTAVGAGIGGFLGGLGGGIVGGALGAGGGTLVAPGVGTVGGGISGADAGAGIGAAGGAVVGGYIGNQVGDALDNIMQMAKGGSQNIENEYSREARKQPDPCDWLAKQYAAARSSGNSAAAQKIIKAQKALGCRNTQKRCE
jgi:RHS repeat-associated protein